MWGWLWLQGSDDDALVQGVTRHNLKQDQGMRATLEAGFYLQESLNYKRKHPWVPQTPPALVLQSPNMASVLLAQKTVTSPPAIVPARSH